MNDNAKGRLEPYVSMPGAWALSIGTSIGWGSLVVTCSDYLAKSGPAGVIIGLILGCLMMLVIARCFYSMMVKFPSSGGIYSYSKKLFDYDRAFLASWFMLLTYFAIFWANATSLPLFMRYFAGDIFRFGYMYSIFGYDVYFGELLLTIVTVALTTVFVANARKALNIIMVILVGVFSIGIIAVFVAMLFRNPSIYSSKMKPYFLEDSSGIRQVIRITCLSSWAFVGFESLSFSSAEFKFDKKMTHKVLIYSIIVTTFLYCALTILSVSAYPAEYGSWTEYIRDLDSLSGLSAIPAFYAAQTYMGDAGVLILMIVLIALVLTSLIANVLALSRLIYSLACDGVFPKGLSYLSKKNIPVNAVILVGIISCILPFVGRTAIGWVVDVTNICAVIMYLFISSLTVSAARVDGNKYEKAMGYIGLALMVLMAFMILLPSLILGSEMAPESYFLFIVWSVLGCLYFRRIIRNDKSRRFGNEIVVWIVFLSLIAIMSIIWMNKVNDANTNEAVESIAEYYINHGAYVTEEGDAYIRGLIESLHRENLMTGALVFVLFAAAIFVVLWNFSYIRKREKEIEQELSSVKSYAGTDPLTGVKSKHAYVKKEEDINARIDAGLSEFAVIVGDVNGLKTINDSLGHKVGDEYIKASCMVICQFFKHSPVYRIGGDEFVAILEGADYEDREMLLSDLNDLIEENVRVGAPDVKHPVISVGISCFIEGDDTAYMDVFTRADEEMYKSKLRLKEMGAAVR